jgi:hypothetical protein
MVDKTEDQLMVPDLVLTVKGIRKEWVKLICFKFFKLNKIITRNSLIWLFILIISMVDFFPNLKRKTHKSVSSIPKNINGLVSDYSTELQLVQKGILIKAKLEV